MLNEDTQTITTRASRYDYSMALVRAIAAHLQANEAAAEAAGAVTVYVPHWLDAGEPWQLMRVGERPTWIVVRSATTNAETGALVPACAFRFGDAIAQAAAAMLAWDQTHPFRVVAEPAFFPVGGSRRA